jgi:Helix-turn-helix domain
MDAIERDFGKLLEIDEVARLFGVSLTTVRRYCALRNGRRKLSHFKFGRRILISSHEANRLLFANKEGREQC